MDETAILLAALFEGVALGTLAMWVAYKTVRRIMKKLDSPQGFILRLPGGALVVMRMTGSAPCTRADVAVEHPRPAGTQEADVSAAVMKEAA